MRLPPLDESVAAHLSQPMAIGWTPKVTHLSRPCKTTVALDGRSILSSGHAASVLHSMFQVYKAKLLHGMD